jgi:hypothetical protein
VVPKIFQHVFVELNECVNDEKHFAGMAQPTNRQYDLSKEQGLLTVDNGATMTLTKSLLNMTDVQQKVVTIQLTGAGMSLQSTHIGYKTYYAIDATGSIRPIETKAFDVPKLEQDLLGGRALIKSNYRITMNADESISGIFSVVKGEIVPATRFPFADSEGLFYIETVPISETKYSTMSGFNLWHMRFNTVRIKPSRTRYSIRKDFTTSKMRKWCQI